MANLNTIKVTQARLGPSLTGMAVRRFGAKQAGELWLKTVQAFVPPNVAIAWDQGQTNDGTAADLVVVLRTPVDESTVLKAKEAMAVQVQAAGGGVPEPPNTWASWGAAVVLVAAVAMVAEPYLKKRGGSA